MYERILISGASIAGLTVAHWLARYGFRPTVVERAAGLRPLLLDPLDLHPEADCPRIRRLGDLLQGEV